MTLRKKWQLLFIYIKTLRNNIHKIKNHFVSDPEKRTYIIKDLRIDNIYRIYTVLNFQKDSKENIKKYGYVYLDNEVKKFITELSNVLKKYGINEFVGLTRADQIAKDGFLIIIEFKFLKTSKIARRILLSLLSIILIASYFIFY